MKFNVFTPPTVNIGDVLNFTAIITPVAGDFNTNDNVFNLNQTVIGSYDPNDISCLEGDAIALADIDKYLHYVIRFQNSGTASAINIVVKNILDANLDWSTLQLETVSHNSRVAIKNGNVVEFIFENINLPDENTDEPSSHGFIAYKIKPKGNADVGDIFYNSADIFFDYNLPITTNIVSTMIDGTLYMEENLSQRLLIYPNPTSSILKIKANKNVASVDIYNLLGQQMFSDKLDSMTKEIDMSRFNLGIYLVKVEMDGQFSTHKIVKE